MEPAVRPCPCIIPVAGPREPGVWVTDAWRYIGSHGEPGAVTVKTVRVPVDFAGDLSWQAQGGWWISSATWPRLGSDVQPVLTWHAWGIGFILDDASEALDAACREAQRQRAPLSPLDYLYAEPPGA